MPAKIANIGTMVSGMAVPTAANNEPVTPSEIFKRSPKCSKAFTNTSAANTISTNIANMNRINMR